MAVTGVPQVLSNLESALFRMRNSVVNGQEINATTAENFAKGNRPWTDRTGNARQSIRGSVGRNPANIRMALAIGVTYGKYLELSNGGKYAIVWSSMNRLRRQFLYNVASSVRFK